MMLEANARQRAALEQRLRNQHLSRSQGYGHSSGQGQSSSQESSSSSSSSSASGSSPGVNAAILQHAIRRNRLSRFCPRKRLPRSLFGNNGVPNQGHGSTSTNSNDGDYLEDTCTVNGVDNPNWRTQQEDRVQNEFLQEGNRAYEESLRQSLAESQVRLELVQEDDEEQDDNPRGSGLSRIEGEVCEISSSGEELGRGHH